MAGESVDPTSHFYCGCEASVGGSAAAQGGKSKVQANDMSAGGVGDVDKQTLITGGDESLEEDSEKQKKQEWIVENPTVAFEREFGGVLSANRDIKIFGTVHSRAFSFTVNLCHGAGLTSDIGLHLNPRFDQRYIPRNARINRHWGIEEAQTGCAFPLVRGEAFFLEIFLTHHEFLVSINGIHFCAFAYRYPIFNLDRIEVFGDISLQRVQYTVISEYPSRLPDSSEIERRHHFLVPPQSKMEEKYSLDLRNYDPPFVISLEDKVKIGTEIEICGRVKLLPHSFYVNLQQGKQIWPHPLINLHVNARFRETPGSGGCTILGNAWINDGWGSEQYANRELYFSAGQCFKLKIECADDVFRISHDGNILMMFHHRSDYGRINTLYIVGDVSISNLTFQ